MEMTKDKIKLLFVSQFFPLFIGRYFLNALNRRTDLDIRSAGVYTGSFIPWGGGMTLPDKYAIPPTYILPHRPGTHIKVAYEILKPAMKDWKPDVVFVVDAGLNFAYKPQDGVTITVATDGHCLNGWYQHGRQVSDYFFNMHPYYAEKGDHLLSYAFDPSVHYAMSNIEKDTDAVLIGMNYPQRDTWINMLRSAGVNVIYENGPIMDEYREIANRANIGLNWASLLDTNARVYETMAMNLCLVTNRTPDLATSGFIEGEHYLGFDTVDEAVEKVLYAKNEPEWAKAVALAGYNKVNHDDYTYDGLVNKIFKEVGIV